MAKFSQIAKGTRALKQVTFPLLDGETQATCSLRPLLGSDDAIVLDEARAFAISHKVADPKDGNPLYEFGKAIAVCLHACVDSESDPKNPDPYFESAEQIQAGLDRERIFLLSEWQARHQESVSPRPSSSSAEEYIADIYKIASAAEGEDLPFALWPRSRLESSFLFSANLLVSLLERKSPTGSDSAEKPSSSDPSPKLDS